MVILSPYLVFLKRKIQYNLNVHYDMMIIIIINFRKASMPLLRCYKQRDAATKRKKSTGHKKNA